MGIQAPAEVKYRLIYDAINLDDNTLKVSTLCRIAGVSRSGYYAWVGAASQRWSREAKGSYSVATVPEEKQGMQP